MVSARAVSCGPASAPPTMPAMIITSSPWLRTASTAPATNGMQLAKASMPALKKDPMSRPRISIRRESPRLRGASGATPGPGLL